MVPLNTVTFPSFCLQEAFVKKAAGTHFMPENPLFADLLSH